MRSVEHIHSRAAAYGMHGEAIDGMDVEAVHEAASRLVERARRGEAINEGLRQLMASDPDIFIVGEDIHHSLRGLTRGLVACILREVSEGHRNISLDLIAANRFSALKS